MYSRRDLADGFRASGVASGDTRAFLLDSRGLLEFALGVMQAMAADRAAGMALLDA